MGYIYSNAFGKYINVLVLVEFKHKTYKQLNEGNIIMATIYVVGTPIGNLEDITFRAIETLKKVDFILAEDTRKTKILLDRYKIKKELISYYHHSGINKIEHIIDLLKSGKDLALVTDAGTPGISDPGGILIDKIWKLKKEENYNIIIMPIPGVSSMTTLLSVSGFPSDDFLFLGFLPKKKGRKTLLENLKKEKRILVFFESPFRIVKTLDEMKNVFGDAEVAIGRELTKKFEEIIRGTITEVVDVFKKKNPKGEFVVVLNNRDSIK